MARGNQMRLRCVIFTELTVGIGTGGIEVSQRNGPDPVGAVVMRQRTLDGQLRLAVRVDGLGRM